MIVLFDVRAKKKKNNCRRDTNIFKSLQTRIHTMKDNVWYKGYWEKLQEVEKMFLIFSQENLSNKIHLNVALI